MSLCQIYVWWDTQRDHPSRYDPFVRFLPVLLLILRTAVVRPPEDQAHLRRLGVFHFAHFINDVSLDLLPSKRVREEGHVIFEEEVPTSHEWVLHLPVSGQRVLTLCGRWESARIKSYGSGKLIKGEEYDVEYIAGLQVRHWHWNRLTRL